jgi:hypothetical protein
MQLSSWSDKGPIRQLKPPNWVKESALMKVKLSNFDTLLLSL